MIWIILLIGFILRIISLNQSLWLDEAINTLAVKNYSLINFLTQYMKADFHPPGWLVILWLWTKLFGYSEIAVRIPSVIFGLLTVWIVYLICKKLVSKRVGVVAGLLTAVNPLLIYYSQEARMYALATLAVSINIFLLIKLIKREKINLILFFLSNLLVLTSDYLAYFIFPAEFVFLFLYDKKIIKRWFIALIGAVSLSIFWLPIFFSQLTVGSTASSNLPSWKYVVGAFDFKTIPLTFVKFIIGRISVVDKTLYTLVLIPICSLFAFSLYKAVRSSGNLQKKLLLSWIIIPLLIATVISIFIPIFNYFRVLFVLPPFIILISLGILSFKNKWRYIFLVSILLIEILSSVFYLFNSFFQREDWKGLVNFLNKQNSPLILFESSGTLPPFDYYDKGNLNAIGALKNFPVKNESDIVDLEDLLNKREDLYLVDYLVEISDPNRLTAKKLVSLGYKLADTKDFHGVGFVYHYVKK